MSQHPASLPLASLLLFSLALHGALALKLCSFNVRSFGESKKENQNATDVIVKVSHLCITPSHGFSLKGLEADPQGEVRAAVTTTMGTIPAPGAFCSVFRLGGSSHPTGVLQGYLSR